MQLSTVLIIAVSAAAVSAQRAPPKPQQTLDANTLNSCTSCATASNAWVQCQNLELPKDLTEAGKVATECVCKRSSSGYDLSCRDCLLLAANQQGPEGDFYDALGQFATNKITACGSPGGSVSAGNGKVCATTSMGEACVSFGEGMSWTSMVDRQTKQVVKYEAAVNLPEGMVIPKAVEPPAPSSSTAASTSASASAAASSASHSSAGSGSTHSASAVSSNGTLTTPDNSTIPTPLPATPDSSAMTLTWTASAVGGAVVCMIMAML